MPIPGLPLRPPEECRVLVVDDDERIVEVFSAMLERDGYQVLVAADGPGALEAIRHQQPDVAVLDIILPGIDGIEVCRRIKYDPETRFLPVILVTGLADRANRLDGLRAGADDFLEKPPDPLELTARVRSLLRTKQLYDEVEAHRRELEERVAERTRELRAAYERLQALNRVKDNVLGIVSHELRTPLHQAKIALDLMAQDGIDEEKRATLFRDALAAFGQLEYRIRDIQAFSDPSDLRIAPTSLRDVLMAAIEQVRSLHRGVQDAITLDVPKRLPPVMVSPSSMTRAIAHLILNAVKFGDGKPVTVRAAEAAGAITLSIRDEGIGINPDLMSHLFEPLRPGDDSSTRRHGGLGIGLALVKMIADAHNISVGVESQQGKGTTVTLVLPIADL
jgi:signal transduction histidine kinase